MKRREREEEVEGKPGEKGDTGGKEEGGNGEGKGREAKLLEERVEGRTREGGRRGRLAAKCDSEL